MDKGLIKKIIISIVLLVLTFPLIVILFLAYSQIFMCSFMFSSLSCTLTNIVSMGGAILIVITLILNLFRKKSEEQTSALNPVS